MKVFRMVCIQPDLLASACVDGYIPLQVPRRALPHIWVLDLPGRCQDEARAVQEDGSPRRHGKAMASSCSDDTSFVDRLWEWA